MASYQYITSTGVIVPDTATTRAEVEAEFRAIFGADMPVDPSTPQGGFITMLTQERDGIARNNAELANQINPDLAGGVFLDALLRFTGGTREPATFSTLSGVELGGVPLTLIPAGSLASVETTGALFELITDVTLDAIGEGLGNFRALDAGPIEVPVNGLNGIASGVLGWETVSNPTVAVPGRLAEGDIPARLRRRSTLALQTISIVEAIYGALYDVEGVQSLSFRENIASTNQTIDGILMVPHSVYACVDGGADQDVAQALYQEKTAGANYNGTTTVNVTDPRSGQIIPVKFSRPSEITTTLRFTIAPTALDAANIIPDAVIAYRDGELNGDRGFTVGKDVSPFELAGAVHQVEPSIFIKLVEISTNGGVSWSSSTLAVNIDQVARIARASVLVVTA
jgi:hypothetical protein